MNDPQKNSNQKTDPRVCRTGFALIEVALSIGVLAITLTGVLTLIGNALQHCRKCADETAAALLGSMVLETLQSEPFEQVELFADENLPSVSLEALNLTHPPLVLFASMSGMSLPSDSPTPAADLRLRQHPKDNLPTVLRSLQRPPEAEYAIELRFEPIGKGTVPYEYRPRGTFARMRIRHLRSHKPVLECVQFIHRNAQIR
jgi:hypothetical protein